MLYFSNLHKIFPCKYLTDLRFVIFEKLLDDKHRVTRGKKFGPETESISVNNRIKRIIAANSLEGLLFSLGPGSSIRTYREKYYTNIARYTVLEEETRNLIELLNSKKITALRFKGAFLAERLYSNAGERPFYDIDILIPGTEKYRAIKIIEASGYRPLHNSLPSSVVHVFKKNIPRCCAAIELELHTHPLSLTPARKVLHLEGLALDSLEPSFVAHPALTSRGHLSSFQSQAIKMEKLRPPDLNATWHLAVAILHLSLNHGLCGALRWIDIFLMLEKWKRQIDFHALKAFFINSGAFHALKATGTLLRCMTRRNYPLPSWQIKIPEFLLNCFFYNCFPFRSDYLIPLLLSDAPSAVRLLSRRLLQT